MEYKTAYEKDNITVNPHCCTREGYQELIDYLRKNCWDYTIEKRKKQYDT